MSVPLSGYFHITASLTTDSPTANVLDNQDEGRFGVYNVQDKGSFIHNAPLGYFWGLAPTAGGTNLGTSDPSIARLLGIRSVRVKNDYASRRYENETYQTQNNKNEMVTGVSKLYDILSGTGTAQYLEMYSNPTGIDPNDMAVFGSIKYDGNNFQSAKDMVSFLTYLPPGSAVGDYAANPIQWWSLDNEPEAEEHYNNISLVTTTGQIKDDFVRGRLGPGYTAVHNAYDHPDGPVNPSRAYNPPKIIAPNLNTVEANSRQPDGTYNGPLTWMRDFFSSQDLDGKYAAEKIDAVGLHTYTGDDRSWEEHGVYESLLALETMMDLPDGSGGYLYHGTHDAGKRKPLWITEHGWNWSWTEEMSRLQGAYLVRRNALAASLGIPSEHNAYFYAEEAGDAGNFYYLYTGNPFLLTGTPLRGGMAMRIYNEMTAGQTYDDTPSLYANLTSKTGKYVHAVPYRDINGPNETIVVWGNDFTDPQFFDDGQARVLLPLNSDSADLQFFDIMGNPILVTRQRNLAVYTYYVPATGSPVYVTGPHSASYTITNGSWPVLTGDTNYALNEGNMATGAQAFASSFAPMNAGNNPPTFYDASLFTFYFCSDTTASNPAANLNDGIWQYDDRASNGRTTFPVGVTVMGTPLESLTKVKSVWIGNTVYPLPVVSPPPVLMAGDHATVMFTQPKTIDTLVAVVPSSNNSTGGTLCGARDYQFQITTDGTTWTPVKTVYGNKTEWVLYAPIASQTIRGMRLVIGAVNNGRWYDDYNAYSNGGALPIQGSPKRAMIYELEAYGLSGQ